MALKDNIKFKSLQNEVIIQYENIIKDNKLDNEERKNKIFNLLKIDNTNENVVFEFLNLQTKILNNSKDDSLKKILHQYEYCIEENKFNESFQVIKVTKISYKKRIMDLIKLIKEYNSKKSLEEKIDILDKIYLGIFEKFDNTIPINYNSNLELYFYSLYDMLNKQILNFCKENFVSQNKIKNYIKEPMIIKLNLLFSNMEENKDKIKSLDKSIKFIPFIYGTFNEYLCNLSRFINKTYNNFYKRFENNQLKDEKEILLFTDYIFFISYFPFINLHAGEYANIWNDTFIDIKIEDKINIAKSFSIMNLNFKLDNNILKVENDLIEEEVYFISNIDDYSFIPLIRYLFIYKQEPDLIYLNKFLKIDKYNENLYIRKIWKPWENFLIKVFTSKLIKSLFYKISTSIKKNNNLSNPYLFLDEEEIKLIINNTRYFIFDSDFNGITLEKNLLIYQSGDPYIIKSNPIRDKLFFLTINVVSNIREIIGKLNINLQYFLSKDKRDKLTKLNNILDKDFIKKLIFGNSEPKFCIEQMLYILDIKNYDKDYNSFREEFIKYSKENGYNISIEFEKFIERLDINLNEIYFERHKKFYTP